MLTPAEDRRARSGSAGSERGRPSDPERPSGESDAPLRVAVLCSRKAPGLSTLLERHRSPVAPYRIVSCVTTDPECREAGVTAAAGVPLRCLDIHAFYRERRRPLGDLDLRRDYDRSILEALRPDRPEAVLLCGYRYVATSVLLDAFPGQVFNIHHADLGRAGPDGRPLYRGLRAVHDAIRAGEAETRSTVHVATSRVDEGPLLIRSGPFPVHPLTELARERGREDVLRAYAFVHREWMMEASWGPLLDRALTLVARTRPPAWTPS